MSFRTRLLSAFLVVVIAPLIVLGLMIPREMKKRFTAQYNESAVATAARMRGAIADENAQLSPRLAEVARGLRDDNEVRRSVVMNGVDRSELLDYAQKSMQRTGLALLQIQNDSGRILSSGHFRNEFDRVDTAIVAALAAAPGGSAIVRVRKADGIMLALTRAESVQVGTRRLSIVGGMEITPEYLRYRISDRGIGVVLLTDGKALVSSDSAVGMGSIAIDSIPITFIDASGDSVVTGIAELVITHSTAELNAAIRDVRVWIIGTILAAVVAALAVALWLAAWLSKPIADLATESARIDLDNSRIRFTASDRDDEVGILARRLATMVERMRASAARLNDAERRATVGEIARQVNHDIKNGLTPIRNVVRHLSQVTRDNPSELPALFAGRQQTLESSIEYLDTLARNYAKLSPRLDVAPCDVRPVIEDVVRSAATRGSNVKSSFAPDIRNVVADAAVLRRILENLVGNAIDALDGRQGEVVVSAARTGAEREHEMVRIVVSDSGRGMTSQQLQKAFDDFYTTKEGGTGLGLSVVRRLVADLSGVLKVETAPGQGTRVIVDIPAADGKQRAPVGAGSTKGSVR